MSEGSKECTPEALVTQATVLVVDDTPENIVLLSEVLRDDYRVKVANCGERALRIAASDDKPDLILLDVMMPGMDGFEVCRRLKADPDTALIPVLFVTAKDEVKDEEQGFILGAVDYIIKPISPPLVRARVATHLALYDQERFLEAQLHQRSAELIRTRTELIRQLHTRLVLGQVSEARADLEAWADRFGISLAEA